MADYTGSILELKEKKAVVMTDTCDFVSIKKQPHMFVGQQIKFKKSDIYTTNMHYSKYIALIASVFILTFCSIFYFQFYSPNSVFAYIDVDINPSLELSIDKSAKVLNIKPLNDDAKLLIKDLKLVDLPLKQAIDEVVDASKRQGFISLNKENAVLISASIEKNNESTKSDETVLDNILAEISTTEYKVETEELTTEIIKVSPESRNSAIKNNISMGRYSLYSKIKEEDVEITVEKAKNASVSDMIKKAKTNNSNKGKFDSKDKTKDDDDKSYKNKVEDKKSSETITNNSSDKKSDNKYKNKNKEKEKEKEKYKDKDDGNSSNKKRNTDLNVSNNINSSPDEKDSFDQGSIANSTNLHNEQNSDQDNKDIFKDNDKDKIKDSENNRNTTTNNNDNNTKNIDNNENKGNKTKAK